MTLRYHALRSLKTSLPPRPKSGNHEIRRHQIFPNLAVQIFDTKRDVTEHRFYDPLGLGFANHTSATIPPV